MRKRENFMNDVIWECVEPDKNNKFNFVFDTCIFEQGLSNDFQVVKMCKAKLSEKYRFFITQAQLREISGVPDRKLTYNESSTWKPSGKIKDIEEIFMDLRVKRISCLSLFYLNFTVLDGTFREWYDKTSEEPIAKMLYEIDKNNNNHRRDAVIAESAIYNNCNYISMDSRPIRIVNKYFPCRAFHYNDFIAEFLTKL